MNSDDKAQLKRRRHALVSPARLADAPGAVFPGSGGLPGKTGKRRGPGEGCCKSHCRSRVPPSRQAFPNRPRAGCGAPPRKKMHPARASQRPGYCKRKGCVRFTSLTQDTKRATSRNGLGHNNRFDYLVFIIAGSQNPRNKTGIKSD